jgi:HEPN domain-containing protein
MKQRELAELFMRKALEDEALLDAVVTLPNVADATFGFHCQQAAEKLMKALLSRLGIRFRRTHDLQELMSLLEDAGEALPAELGCVDELTPYGVEFRYDEILASRPFDRQSARALVRDLRAHIERRLADITEK